MLPVAKNNGCAVLKHTSRQTSPSKFQPPRTTVAKAPSRLRRILIPTGSSELKVEPQGAQRRQRHVGLKPSAHRRWTAPHLLRCVFKWNFDACRMYRYEEKLCRMCE